MGGNAGGEGREGGGAIIHKGDLSLRNTPDRNTPGHVAFLIIQKYGQQCACPDQPQASHPLSHPPGIVPSANPYD